MGKKREEPGVSLSGKTSDRIRRGEIAAGKVHRTDEVPKPWAILRAVGRGLGRGATRKRGGDETS